MNQKSKKASSKSKSKKAVITITENNEGTAVHLVIAFRPNLGAIENSPISTAVHAILEALKRESHDGEGR
jgi:hypothetical protein